MRAETLHVPHARSFVPCSVCGPVRLDGLVHVCQRCKPDAERLGMYCARCQRRFTLSFREARATFGQGFPDHPHYALRFESGCPFCLDAKTRPTGGFERVRVFDLDERFVVSSAIH